MNPELRQTLQTFSRNLDSTATTAQENIYTFTQLYIDPCLSGAKSCIADFTRPCFPYEDSQHLRRKHGRSRGRAELNFDFYDDWDYDDDDPGQSLLGWRGERDLDRVLAGTQTTQPARQRAMSYGSASRSRKGGMMKPSDAEADPTIIPSSSYLGFLQRLPWKIGGKGIRYKPSAADLQENPGGVRIRDVEAEALLEEDEHESDGKVLDGKKGHARKRSATSESRSTINSLSSRGDLIPSDMEEEDAVALDDEFTMILARRTTNTGSEDHSSSKTNSSKRPDVSRASTRTASSRSTKSRQSSSKKSIDVAEPVVLEDVESPTLVELRQEEAQMRDEQEAEVEKRRVAEQKLAIDKGLRTPASEVQSPDTKSDTASKEDPPEASLPMTTPVDEPPTDSVSGVEQPQRPQDETWNTGQQSV